MLICCIYHTYLLLGRYTLQPRRRYAPCPWDSDVAWLALGVDAVEAGAAEVALPSCWWCLTSWCWTTMATIRPNQANCCRCLYCWCPPTTRGNCCCCLRWRHPQRRCWSRNRRWTSLCGPGRGWTESPRWSPTSGGLRRRHHHQSHQSSRRSRHCCCCACGRPGAAMTRGMICRSSDLSTIQHLVRKRVAQTSTFCLIYTKNLSTRDSKCRTVGTSIISKLFKDSKINSYLGKAMDNWHRWISILKGILQYYKKNYLNIAEILTFTHQQNWTFMHFVNIVREYNT